MNTHPTYAAGDVVKVVSGNGTLVRNQLAQVVKSAGPLLIVRSEPWGAFAVDPVDVRELVYRMAS